VTRPSDTTAYAAGDVVGPPGGGSDVRRLRALAQSMARSCDRRVAAHFCHLSP